jgi:curved DNA-binding protein CbpA
MIRAFEILGLDPCLVIHRDQLHAAFREAGKSEHPDAGGDEHRFAILQQALEILLSPSKRLKHWLELRGVIVEPRGTIGPAMMEMFARIGEVTQRAEAVIRKRQAAKSALGLALLESESQACREDVENAIAWLDREVENQTSGFSDLESAESIDVEVLSEVIRNLAFLEKWQLLMRSIYSRLV